MKRIARWGLLASFLSFLSLDSQPKDFSKAFLIEPLVDSPGKNVGSDFNGDGIQDMLFASDQNDDGPGDNAGAAYVLFGTPLRGAQTYRLDGAGVSVTILGKADSDRLGASLASAGDINSDGFDDIVVGAFNNDDIASNSG
ncbi:MAG: integrin alpha, partial [Deltaproteobacteria bacterium]